MAASDWIQAISLLLVALALLLGVLQLRQMEKQSIATGRSHPSGRVYSDYRVALLKDDPELLEWHLRNSKYPVGSVVENKRLLFLMGKLDAYERNVINYHLGLLNADAWQAWKTVLKSDTPLPELLRMWPAARPFYVPSFVAEVDEILSMAGASPDPPT